MSINPEETGPIVALAPGGMPLGNVFAVVMRPGNAVPVPRPATLLLEVGRDALGSDDIAAVIDRLQPDGILLSDCRGRADLQAADVALGVIEAETEQAAGHLSIVAVLGVAPMSFLGGERLAGASERLIALVLDEDAISDALGLPADAARSAIPAFTLASAHMVLQASDAKVPCFRCLPSRETDPSALERLRNAAVAQGFQNIVIRPAAQEPA